MKPNKRLYSLADSYFSIKSNLLESGYLREILWEQSKVIKGDFSESEFLRESSWVILNGGMKENVIRGIFGALSNVFLNWESALGIVENKDICLKNGLQVFGHSGKINAICEVSNIVSEIGMDEIRLRIETEGVKFLKTFPYLGEITSLHLLKNLGYDVMKPDRHLIRISNHLGFSNPETMCLQLGSLIDEKISVIDIVLWRFANSNRHYLDFFD